MLAMVQKKHFLPTSRTTCRWYLLPSLGRGDFFCYLGYPDPLLSQKSHHGTFMVIKGILVMDCSNPYMIGLAYPLN